MNVKNYTIRCLQTNETFNDIPDNKGNFLLKNPHLDTAQATLSFLRSEYNKYLEIKDTSSSGLFAYSWLPKNFDFQCSSYPITYKSIALANVLGLKNLYITFSGYNYNLGANTKTGTFKEYEALSVFARQGGYGTYSSSAPTLVVASAGNTARAFLEIGSQLDAKVLIIVPTKSIDQLWSTVTQGKNIHIIAIDGDYYDCIQIAEKISHYDSFVPEGGARNIARRDGMGIPFLSAVKTMKRIPDHYFQAIGSGCGAISVWEAADRLLSLGILDTQTHSTTVIPASTTLSGLPKLHLSQNAPFTPVVDAWKSKSKTIIPLDYQTATHQINTIYAQVLSNRNPPYALIGGLYEALSQCEGCVYACTNKQGYAAATLFNTHEKFNIVPSAQIALASLIQAIHHKKVHPESYIMLNITGGGIDEIWHTLNPKTIKKYHLLSKNASEYDIMIILKKCKLI